MKAKALRTQKRLLLYDGGDGELFMAEDGRDILFSAAPPVKTCTGCFGCWVKTPGRCVLDDRASALPGYLKQCAELAILSPIWYGGYSPNVKAAVERCLGYMLPYFRVIGGETHHRMRYDNPFQLSVHFYGACDDEEKEIARRLVRANAVNLGAGGYSVAFHDSFAAAGRAVR